MQRRTWLSSYSPELSSNTGVDEEIGGGVDTEKDVAGEAEDEGPHGEPHQGRLPIQRRHWNISFLYIFGELYLWLYGEYLRLSVWLFLRLESLPQKWVF